MKRDVLNIIVIFVMLISFGGCNVKEAHANSLFKDSKNRSYGQSKRSIMGMNKSSNKQNSTQSDPWVNPPTKWEDPPPQQPKEDPWTEQSDKSKKNKWVDPGPEKFVVRAHPHQKESKFETVLLSILTLGFYQVGWKESNEIDKQKQQQHIRTYGGSKANDERAKDIDGLKK